MIPEINNTQDKTNSQQKTMFFHSNKSSPDNSTTKPKEHEAKQQAAAKETPRSSSAKIQERLDKVMQETSPLDKNRSADLVPLSAEYEQMKHKLRALVSAVKLYKHKTEDMSNAKFEVSVIVNGRVVSFPRSECLTSLFLIVVGRTFGKHVREISYLRRNWK
jgi:hypothetical protein